MKFITWLNSLFNLEEKKMSDQSVTEKTAAQPAAAQPAAAQSEAAVDTAAKTDTGIVATVEHDLGQFYSIVKALAEKYGEKYIQSAIEFAKEVSAKK